MYCNVPMTWLSCPCIYTYRINYTASFNIKSRTCMIPEQGRSFQKGTYKKLLAQNQIFKVDTKRKCGRTNGKIRKFNKIIPLFLSGFETSLQLFAASLLWHHFYFPMVTMATTDHMSNTISMASDCPFSRWHTIHPVLLTSPPLSRSCSVCLCVFVRVWSKNVFTPIWNFPSLLLLNRLSGFLPF